MALPRVWDAATGEERLSLSGHTNSVLDAVSVRIRVSPLPVATEQRKYGMRLRVRNCGYSTVPDGLTGVSFSPDG